LSEQQLSDPRGHSHGRAWYRTGFGIGAIVVVILIAATAGTGYYVQDREERVKFLVTTPDTIPNNPELVSYAMPRGKSAFASHCASCHGVNMKGDPLKGIPDLTDNDFLYGSGRVSQIERIIMYGIRSGNSKGWDLASMPAFGTAKPYPRYTVASLTPEELDDITSYVYAFQHAPTTIAEKESVARGSIIFHDYIKGVCWDCHANDAQGDTAIGAPDLVDKTWLYGDGSREWIHHSIAFGLEGYCPAWTDRLSPVTIRSIAVYVNSIQRNSAKAHAVRTASAGGTK
jgi:cytochrome c oxidase cbb3-type subunit 3